MTPTTPSTIRDWYTARLAAAHAEGTQPSDIFRQGDDYGFLDSPERRAAYPASVVEAYDFYDAAFMKPDIGSVGVYAVDAAGTPTLAVFCRDDGFRCRLEVFDTRGEPIGAASSEEGATTWSDAATLRAGA